MQIYILLACDRLEEAEENRLLNNKADILAAFQSYSEAQNFDLLQLILDADDSYCENWRIGLQQPIKKAKQLLAPVNFCNDLAQQFQLDFEIGEVQDDSFDAVSYFGFQEGKGDPFMLAQYLDL